MKSLFVSFLFITIITHLSFAQVKDAAKNLKQQATKMGAAFTSSDYTTFAKYTYPRLLQLMGGVNKMKEALSIVVSDMKSKGMSFGNITIDEPSKLITTATELQSTIPQHTEVKLRQGRVVATSTLIAISKDNGNNWTFVDTANKDIADLRKLLPNLSSEIVIPPQQQPVHYDN